MKNRWKYFFIGIATVALEWSFLALLRPISNLDQTGIVVVGAALFLAFEMVICTGAIISKIGKNKE